MKKASQIMLVFLFIAGTTIGQEFTDPGAFNNFIVTEQAKVTAKNLEYISFSVHSEDYKAIEAKRMEVLRQVESSKQAITGVSIKGGEKMKEEALNVMQSYLETFEIDFPMAEALKKESESSYEAMEAYFVAQDKAEKKLSQASDRLTKAQEKLAKDFDMEIVEQEMDNEAVNVMQRINEVNEYSRKVYLVNFKVSKVNAAFWDAINTNDKKSIELKRAEVEKTATEAYNILATMPDFRGNVGYRDSAKELVGFYKNMAIKDYKSIVTVVSKEQAELTQVDVDGYNEAISKYNSSIQGLTNNFNRANQRLMQQNVPNMSGGGNIKRM